LPVLFEGVAAKVLFTPLCNNALAADGKSSTTPYLSDSSGLGTLSWSIIGNKLGCILTNGPVILAGTREGMITVRATGTNGCSFEGKLRLGGSGCQDGTCSSSGGTSGTG